MHKLVYILIITLFFSITSANSQLNSERIYEVASEESEKVTILFSLTKVEQARVTKAYVDYYTSLVNAAKSPKRYSEKVEAAEKAKSLEIEKVLGKSRLKSYKMFENIYTNESIDYYKTLYQSVGEIKELEFEIAEYYRLKIFPLISKLRMEFDTVLAPRDKRAIDQIKDSVYLNLTLQSDTLVNNLSENQTELYFTLLNFSNKYDSQFGIMYQTINKFVAKWESDIDEILSSYYTPQQVESFSNQDVELAKLGVLGSINKLSFLILEPYDIQKFYKNLLLIENIKKTVVNIRLEKAKQK